MKIRIEFEGLVIEAESLPKAVKIDAVPSEEELVADKPVRVRFCGNCEDHDQHTYLTTAGWYRKCYGCTAERPREE